MGSIPFQPNKKVALGFLEALFGPDTEVTFQFFDDRPEKDPKKAWISHTKPWMAMETLSIYNRGGSGVFFCVNPTDGKGRKRENVTAVHCLIADDDTGTAKPFKEPWAISKTRNGFHYYWKLESPSTDFERCEEMNKRIALTMGTDPKVFDRCRVMRVPGFYHMKGEPFLVLAKRGGGGVTTLDEIDSLVQKLPPKPIVPPPTSFPDVDKNSVRFRASRYVSSMRPSISGQSGHVQLWNAAQALCRGFALPPGEALAILMEHFNPRCQPPWEARDLERKVQEASTRSTIPVGYLLAGDSNANF